jgi:glycosyltransferase involved in cell wall biosynthesis
MRVTFVLPQVSLSGGMRVLAIYADRLWRRGHDVTVVSVPPIKWSLLVKVRSLVAGRGLPKDYSGEPSFFNDAAVPHHTLNTARPVTDDDVPDADIVLATFWRTASWVAALSPRKGAKAILLQGYETSGDYDPAIDAAWRLPLSKIVVSKWMLKLAYDRFDDSSVYLVPNSVDTTQFFAPPRRKQEIPTVGMLYSTLHLKGVDIALAALRQVRERIKNLRVVALGKEPVSTELALPRWCEYYRQPAQDSIRDIYSKCDLWLCSSRQEGFHLPPLEAMACRCPVVSTSVGGPIDVVDNGVNGYLVPIADVKALADRITELLSFGDARWRAMSDAALATATRYTWDNATDLLEDALREILNSNIKANSVDQCRGAER